MIFPQPFQKSESEKSSLAKMQTHLREKKKLARDFLDISQNIIFCKLYLKKSNLIYFLFYLFSIYIKPVQIFFLSAGRAVFPEESGVY